VKNLFSAILSIHIMNSLLQLAHTKGYMQFFHMLFRKVFFPYLLQLALLKPALIAANGRKLK